MLTAAAGQVFSSFRRIITMPLFSLLDKGKRRFDVFSKFRFCPHLTARLCNLWRAIHVDFPGLINLCSLHAMKSKQTVACLRQVDAVPTRLIGQASEQQRQSRKKRASRRCDRRPLSTASAQPSCVQLIDKRPTRNLDRAPVSSMNAVPMTDIGNGHSLATVTSFDAVMRLLGGVHGVIAITNASRSSVWNWRQAQQFPAHHYHSVCRALRKKKRAPDMRLFRFRSKQKSIDVAA